RRPAPRRRRRAAGRRARRRAGGRVAGGRGAARGGVRRAGPRVRRRALRLAALAALAAALAFGVAASGIVPIKASSRHWPATDWLLHFAMRRSVATHTLFTEVPPLDDPARVLRGAGHYEGGCAPCHGAPGRPLPVVPQRMTPHPPALAERIPDWAP